MPETISNPQAVSLRLIHLTLGDMVCLLIPVLRFIRVEFGGVLYGSDICLLSVFPLAISHHSAFLQKRSILIPTMLGMLWLFAQVVTDLVRESSMSDYTRGWSKIALTITHFIAIALLIRTSKKRFVLYGVGLILGEMLTVAISPTELSIADPWKFGLAVPSTMLVCLIAGVIGRQKRVWGTAMILAMAALNLVLGFRSLGAVCAAVAICAQIWSSLNASGRALRIRDRILTIASIGATAWAFSSIYAYTVENGWLGDQAREKYAIQSSGEGGVLLGGRSELFASSVAIMDSPFIGHGSWAKDPRYKAILHERRVALGYREVYDPTEPDLIPTHSHLFGAWVEAGILGAVFWSWVLWMTARALARASGREPLFAFFVFIALSLMWDILFSPYGADGRFTTTYLIYAMILLGGYSRALNRVVLPRQSSRSHVGILRSA